MLKVLGLGDNVCDKYLHSGYMYPGGQALNFAVYAKLLGVDASYMGVFGTDEVAKHVIATLDELKVEHSRCRQYEGENGYAVVNLVEGDRVFVTSNKGGVAKEHPIVLNCEDKCYLSGFDLIHTSNNSHFDSQLAAAAQLGVPISYDFSGQWDDPEKTAEICKYIDFGFLSCGSLPSEEVHTVCRKLHQQGCKIVVATCGSRGAILYDGIRFFTQPPELVKAIDTLGAGDSFATSFLLSFTQTKKSHTERMHTDRMFFEEAVQTALRRAASFAAKTCLINGAFGMGKKFA
ncbi:MAG: fructoselysine 6-kinase [Tepidanaerobacteraceae bacterium]|nr:fructoselysine 6-kinase [Tepidanaerobacteraceae bacterium]